ncbi:MAG: hypothetical protein WD576_03335 [Nitriliruptoraceae bacterium]
MDSHAAPPDKLDAVKAAGVAETVSGSGNNVDADTRVGTTAVAAPASVASATLRHRREMLAGSACDIHWCRAWSDAVDLFIRDQASGLSASGISIVAVGGYGRRELCPASDIDLLVLHSGADTAELEYVVRTVVYPLWDEQLTVGHAVRDRRDVLDAATPSASVDDLATVTSMLDMRLVYGDIGLLQEIRAPFIRRLRRRGDRFLELLRDADTVRKRNAGDTAELLQPDLKNGAGGLRDLQSLAWASAAIVGTVGIEPLVGAGYVGAPDIGRLAAAHERLTACRVALHQIQQAASTSRRAGDVVTMDVQEAVAVRLGYRDRSATNLAPHQLLHDVFDALRTVDHVYRRAWSLIGADVRRGQRRRNRPAEETVDGFELVDGVLRLPGHIDIADAHVPARVFAALVDTGAILERGAAARLRSASAKAHWSWQPATRELVLTRLLRGNVVLDALAEFDDARVLEAWWPGWSAVRCRAQRNPFHRYPLDRHAWHAVAALGELVRKHDWAATTLEDVDDRDALVVGVLLHDLGKAHGEPHQLTGVQPAVAIAQHLGLAQDTQHTVAKLVELHLLLPTVARTRDLADPAVIADVAGQVKNRSLLACLHLLAAADALATAPGVFNSWTETLMRSLVTKVQAVLDEQHPDDLAGSAAATAHDALQLAAELGATADAVRNHLAMLPQRYSAAVSPRAVVRHTLMAQSQPGAAEVVTRVTPGELVATSEVAGVRMRPASQTGADDTLEPDEIDELDVVAVDHPGWFAKVAGVIALHAGEIIAADAFTRSDELAIDTFRVLKPEGAASSWWARVEGDLAEAAAGRLAVRARVSQNARRDDRRVQRAPDVPTDVTYSLDAGGNGTVIEVTAFNRSGVLYAITSALAELEIDIVVARIDTIGHEARDVFTCRSAEGGPLDEDHIAEVELAIRAAIDAL